jgi:putative toxin-antitoxin system antitoxin component (TIGR02293 family)
MAQARTKQTDPTTKKRPRRMSATSDTEKQLHRLKKKATSETEKELHKLKKKIERLLPLKTVTTPRQIEVEVTPIAEPLVTKEVDRARLVRISALAEKVFGDHDKAHRWLGQPKRALGGKAPLSYVTDEKREQIVKEMLYQIDYGIFS